MSQPTKEPVVKERVCRFIEALLTHAEDSSNFEIHWETYKGTGGPNFVVKTKRRFLESLAQLQKPELTEVIKSLENLRIWNDRGINRGKGSPIGAFALKLWSRDVQRNWEQFERVWVSANEDMKFELDEIHVPLALVQRTKSNKISVDISPKEGSRLYEPTYEEKQRFKHEDFLAQVAPLTPTDSASAVTGLVRDRSPKC
jgi:hypothetical protein